jgi:hypothetical protein
VPEACSGQHLAEVPASSLRALTVPVASERSEGRIYVGTRRLLCKWRRTRSARPMPTARATTRLLQWLGDS